MILFKKYSVPISCSKERFLQMLQHGVYTCSMARSCFPIDDEITMSLIGSVKNDRLRLRCREIRHDGILIHRGCQPILSGKVIDSDSDACTLVYRFLPDSILFPFITLWLAGMVSLSIRKSNPFFLMALPLPYLIAKPLYAICAGQTLKHLNELIETIS